MLVLLSLVHSKSPLPYDVLPEHVSDTTYSGVAKSAKVIAVKVVDDEGCVSYLPPQGLSV